MLIAWELGGGYGHLMKLRTLARALAAAGHRVTLALKTPAAAREVLAREEPFRRVQAPVVGGRRAPMPLSVSYGEVLIRVGWLDAAALTRAVGAWRDLYARVRPDVLVLNHAPTAWLAGSGLPAPRVLCGSGFECPEPRSATPVFRPWVRMERARLADGEARLLESVNRALGAHRLPPLASLADLLQCDRRLLCTYPELDPYAPLRPTARYRGDIGDTGHLTGPAVGDGDAAQVFVYLSGRTRGLSPLLEALAGSGQSVLLHVPGLPPELQERFSGSAMTFSARPVDLQQAARHARLAVCNGGHGTVSAFLCAGCPLLVVPGHVEQWLNARLLEQHGLGVAVDGAGPTAFAGALERLSADRDCRRRAQGFSRRCRDTPPATELASMVAEIAALAGTG